MPLFTYVLCKSMVPNIHSELLFLREFTPSKLKSGQDGFALGKTIFKKLEKKFFTIFFTKQLLYKLV